MGYEPEKRQWIAWQGMCWVLLNDITKKIFTKKIMFQILTADKIIYEQALGMEWSLPEETLLRKEDLPSYCNAMCNIEEGKY